MRRTFLCIFIFLSKVAFCQVSDLLPSSPAVANTSVARTDIWTAFHNPAALVQTASWQLSAQYENHYLTAELSTVTAQAACCNPYLNVGVGFSFFGYDEWNEMMATVCFARRFGRFSVGLAADLIAVYAGHERGYILTGIPQIGFTVDPLPDWTIALHTFNPFMQTLGNNTNSRSVPAVYAIGSEWRLTHDLRWNIDASYDARSTFRIATGVEWRAIEQLTAKIGIYYHNYLVPCLGLAVHLQALRLDFNSELHPLLGVTMQCAVSYQWEQTPQKQQ